MTNKQFNGAGTMPHGGVSAIGQRADDSIVRRCDAFVGEFAGITTNNNKYSLSRSSLEMKINNNLGVRRIALGGKVSGEALTVLSFAATHCLKQKFDELAIKYPLLCFTGEEKMAAEIIMNTIDKPFFDKTDADEKDDEPWDIETWADSWGRCIELVFDDEAITELTESLAKLRGVRVEDKDEIACWVRECGRAVRETAESLTTGWVRTNHDDAFINLPHSLLELKMRNSIACILVGAKLLAKTFAVHRGENFYDVFGVTIDDFEDWFIETQRTDKRK